MENCSRGQPSRHSGNYLNPDNQRLVLYPTFCRAPIPQSDMIPDPQDIVSLFPILPPPPGTPPSRPYRMPPPRQLISPPTPYRVTSSLPPFNGYEVIGNPALQVYRLQLPTELIGRLDGIVSHAEQYARTLPDGWRTDLYSLTKQDLALREIPGMTRKIRPIFDYISQAIQFLYGCRKVIVDKNQPHILKYSVQTCHTGVELHHDRCDVTANLALSKSHEYKGGGTFIPDAGGRVVRLEQGEFLLHPGSLVHGGMDVESGTRYLMVTFAHLK